MRLAIGVGLCCLAFLSDATEKMRTPVLQGDRVVFSNGKELRLERYRVVHRDPLAALKAREPVSISQQAVLINEWQRLLVIEVQKLYEDELKKLSIYDYAGKRYSEPHKFFGEALVLEKVGRIFLAQQSAHHVVRTSYILSPDGKLLYEVNQSPNVFRFEVTPDQQLVWILSNQMADGKPFVRASVIDINGVLVGEFDSYSEKEERVSYGGKRYTIKIPSPQPPG
jgi:hypothetical protein